MGVLLLAHHLFRRTMRQVLFTVILLATAGSSRALAWGCDAHQAVAILAERLLDPSTVMTMRAVLAASPIDPAIKRGWRRPGSGDRAPQDQASSSAVVYAPG